MESTRSMGANIQIHVNDATICYDDFGKGAIPILFIHGFPFDKSSWQPQMEHLKNKYRVIAYDIRGFGISTTGNEKASIDLFADDLIKLLDVLQLDKVIACGLSMGGYILLNAVNRYPGRFEAIILCDTQCIGDTSEGKEKRYKTIQQIKAGGLMDFADGFIKNVFCADSLRDKKETIEKIKKVILSTHSDTITDILTALAERSESCSALPEISIPVLILCGKEDVVTPLAQSEFMLSKIKNATLRSIDEAGHLSNLEQPDQFNKHLDDFISAL
jgi:3-oxoadipate enol-lactonase